MSGKQSKESCFLTKLLRDIRQVREEATVPRTLRADRCRMTEAANVKKG